MSACLNLPGRHPDDRVDGYGPEGLKWRCPNPGCLRWEYRKPVRDYPPEIDRSERGGVAMPRECSGPTPDGVICRNASCGPCRSFDEYERLIGSHPKSWTMPCGLHDVTRCGECYP
jgi:hypothetical protein